MFGCPSEKLLWDWWETKRLEIKRLKDEGRKRVRK